MVVDRARPPPVPIIVVVVPGCARRPTCTVKVEEPELVTEVRLKLAVILDGKPLSLRGAVPENPRLALTVTV